MSKLRPIRDPEFPKEATQQIPAKMKMRNMKVMERKGDQNTEVSPATTEDSIKDMDRVCAQDRNIDVTALSELIVGSELEKRDGRVVIKGQTKQMSCGPILQTIPMGGYTRIGGGESVAHDKAPIEKKPNPVFKFDRKRQIAIRVGQTVGKDYVVVVAANGSIILDTGSYASFHMPVFIVEQTGEYYKVKGGNRILLLGPGSHLILYTNEAPILFVRKDTATRKQSIQINKSLLTKSQSPVIEQKSRSKEKTGSADQKLKHEKTGSDTGSQDSPKTGSKDSPKINTTGRQMIPPKDEPKRASNPPVVQIESESPVIVVKTVKDASPSPPIVVTEDKPKSPNMSPPFSSSPAVTIQTKKSPVLVPPVSEQNPLATTPKTLATTPVARQPTRMAIGPPIVQNFDAQVVPEIVVRRSRARTFFMYALLIIIFIALLFLFAYFRRSGATGPRLPMKTCKNCGRKFKPRQ